MAREAVFDPTDRDVFNEQRQRFDWSLLQNGTVFRYDTRFQLDSACDRLSGLGYLVHRIDAHAWTSVEDMFDAFSEAMGYQRNYGGSIAAFDDVFADVGTFDFGSDPNATGTVLAVAGYDTLVTLDGHTARAILNVFARQARLAGLYGHPMLCLVESTATDFGPVGGTKVLLGSVWDFPPDPPQPFHDTDLIEFVVRFFSSESELAGHLEMLRTAITDTLVAVGRWEMLPPELAPERISPPPEHRRDELTDNGKRQLWEVSIGVRGDGDFSIVGEEIYDRARHSGIVFGGTESTMYPPDQKYREPFLSRYPTLG
ncbi:barstar family protein [Rhodococcus sp. T7]|uniref:barstar family protein n=1 Tax=Rhodococcus sp. T7 TaxID=627444 RepID=UPI00135B7BBD|nr:barstar family protein [Rhodococcus sp. T7]KAF0957217.1 hypothetical protein MLGJGCBP_09047 [Rhodococcus sp. T7]KAF0966821.1 hypothetical protein MLGJGCBP_00016 [Rhodococcus sp. T7]